MKKIFALSLIAALLMGCQQIDNRITDGSVLTATIEPATRTTLVDSEAGYALHWVAGDRIAVSNGTTTALYQAASGGSVTTDFTPVAEPVTGAQLIGYYPETLAGGILPATQKYLEGNLDDMPMIGESTSDPSHLVFQPANGVLRFNISTTQSGIALAAIELSGDKSMSGAVTLVGGTLGVPEGGGVTLDCGEGVALGTAPTAFYIHIPASRYEFFTIRLIATDGREFKAQLTGGDPYQVIRGEVNTVNVAANAFAAPTSDERAVLRTGSDVNELLKKLVDPEAKCTSADATIRSIRILVNSPAKGDVLPSEAGAEPIWASWDAGTSRVTITTRAAEIYTNVNASFLFSRLNALTEIEGIEHLNTSETEYFNGMFMANASANPALTSLDLSHFDTRNAVTFTAMFDSLVNIKSIDLSSFNTAKSRSFANMFNNCRMLTEVDVSHFETGNCETISYMFRYCTALTVLDLHSWDLSKVKDMARAFQYCTSLKTLDLSGDACSTASVTTANHFLNASNVVTSLRLGKNFLLENIAAFPEYFYQGSGYLQTTVEDPLVVECNPWFAQKSLRNSAQALNHTNQRLMVWKNIETGEALEFDEEIGSLTNQVTVKGCEATKVYFDVTTAGEFATVVAQAKAYSGSDEPVIRLLCDVSSASAVNLTNAAGRLLTLDLNGHVLSGSVESFITTSSALVITDSAETKGKITSTASKVLDLTSAGAAVTLKNCVVECTKATGAAWNSDAAVNMSAASVVLNILNSKVYTTKKLSTLRAYNGTLTITGSEISSGTESEGWYVILGLGSGIVVVNSGSFYTSGTGNSSAFHIGASGATMTIHDGWFHSNGRTISGGGTYISKVTLNGGYYDRMPSIPSAGGSYTYGSGKSMQAIDPAATHLHATTGETYSYGYQVK